MGHPRASCASEIKDWATRPAFHLCDLMASHPFDSAQGRLFAQKAREEWATPTLVVPGKIKGWATTSPVWQNKLLTI
jgi:hypothetical protein